MKRDSFIYLMRRKCQVIAHHFFSDAILSKLYFKIYLKRSLNLTKPMSFNEKIQWLKLYNYPNNQTVIKCTDKYTVREYVKKKGFESHLVPLLGVWDQSEYVEWGKLPNSFVLKCTHGCAYNIVVNKKDDIDEIAVKNKLKRWLKEDFGAFNIEGHYSKIEHRRIICEKHLGNQICDYKFFCFNGMPKYVCVYKDVASHENEQIGFFDIDGKKLDLRRDDYRELLTYDFPPFYNEMKLAAETLCKDFIFVRVDLIVSGGQWFFSELTFTPGAGLIPFNPERFDYEWGKQLEIFDLDQNL